MCTAMVLHNLAQTRQVLVTSSVQALAAAFATIAHAAENLRSTLHATNVLTMIG